MDIRSASQLVFKEIREPCVGLSGIVFAKDTDLRSPALTEALVKVHTRLTKTVSALEATQDQVYLTTSVADYVFVPLVDLFKSQDIGDRNLELLLKILQVLIRHCWRIPGSLPSQLGSNLLSLLSFLIGGKPGDVKSKVPRSNEVLQADIACLHELFVSVQSQKRAGLTNFLDEAAVLPSFGYTLTVILNALRNSGDIGVQSTALKALDSVCDLFPEGDTLAMILPGMISTFVKVVAGRGGIKVNYLVLTSVVELATKLLVYTSSDESLGAFVNEVHFKSLEDLAEVSDWKTDTVELSSHSEKDPRNKQWLLKTSSQVTQALKTILKLQAHDKLPVVDAITDLCHNLLSKCFLSLSSAVPALLDTLATIYSRKDYDDSKVLEAVLQLPKLQDTILQRLDAWTTSLSASFLFTDPSRTFSVIKSISFACDVLIGWEVKGTSVEVLLRKLLVSVQENLDLLLTKPKSLKPVITAVPQSIATDILITTQGFGSTEEIKTSMFEGVLDPQVEDALYEMLTLVAQLDPSARVPDSPATESLRLWITRALIEGSQRRKPGDNNWMFEDDETEAAEVVLQERVYDLLESSKALLADCATEEASEAVVRSQVSSLRSVADSCRYLGSDFQYELIDYLYPVVDCLTSASEVVRYEAQKTMVVIAETCYEGSIKDLIFENYDYLVDSLSLNLTGDTITPRTPIVLVVLIKFGGKEILFHLSDVVNTMFTLLDMYHGYAILCESFFAVFSEYIEALERWYLQKYEFIQKENTEKDVLRPWGMKNIEDLVAFLTKERDVPELNQLTLDDVIDKDDSDDEEEDEVVQQEEAKVWESPVPKQLYFKCQQVWNYADRLSTHSSIRLRVLILQVMTKMVRVLSSSPTDFLPNLASSWHLISQFLLDAKCDARLVILTAELGCKFVEYGGGFLAQRFLTLWDSLRSTPWFVEGRLKLERRQSIHDVQAQAMVSLVKFLIAALKYLSVQIPENTAYAIIQCCFLAEPDIEQYGYFADIASLVALEHQEHKKIEN